MTNRSFPKKVPASPAPLPREGYDFVIAALMLVCAGVSAVLSFKGANAVFASAFTSFFFALGVQGAIFVALWMLPGRPMHIKALLGVVWAVAVSFAIGSAFLRADATTEGTDVRKAENALSAWIAQVENERARLLTTAKTAEAIAKGETDGSLGRAGKGPKYNAAMKDKLAAEQELVAFDATAGKTIAETQATLKANPPQKLVDVQRAFDELKAGVPQRYTDGLTTGEIMSAHRGPFERLGHMWAVLAGDVKEGENTVETVGALAVASLMEAICLLLALCRFAIGKGIDKRSLLERLGQSLGTLFALKNLRPVIDRVAENIRNEVNEVLDPDTGNPAPKDEPSDNDSAGPKLAGSKRDARPKKDRRLAANAGKRTDSKHQEHTIDNLWAKSLIAQAKANNQTEADLVKSLLEMKSDRSDDGTELFSDKQFESLAIVLNALKLTHVLARVDRGYVPAQQWDPWIGYLIARSAEKSLHTPDVVPVLRAVS